MPDPERTKILQICAETFVNARLLTTNEIAGIKTIEVSHEALIREWKRLGDWLYEARDDAHFLPEISRAIKEWIRYDKASEQLYRGTKLREAIVWRDHAVLEPSVEERAFIEASIDAEAIAMENIRLYQSQGKQLIELHQIASAMTALADPRLMYEQLSSLIADLMNVEMCGILLYDNERGVLVSQPPFYGVPDFITTMYRIPLQEGTTAYTLYHSHDWWYTNNVKGDDMVRQLGLLNLAEAVGVRSTALAPMSAGMGRLGVVQVSNKRDGNDFSENDGRLLSMAAAQAALVVENARLYDEEQRRADELGGLKQISLATDVLHNSYELYGQINERIGKLMNVQICGIMLYDEHSDQLNGQPPFYGVEDEMVRYYQIAVGTSGFIYDIYKNREYWLSNEPHTDNEMKDSGFDKLQALIAARQTIIVPLIVGGRRLGIVQVANKINGGEFTEAEARILSIFTSQAAAIIDNSRLYYEVQHRTNESEALRHITELAISNLPLVEIVTQIVASSAKLVDGDVVAVGMLNQQTGELIIRPEWTSGMESLRRPFSIDTYEASFQRSAVISQRMLITNDLANDGRVLPIYRGLAERFTFDSIIQVPLVVQERGIGEIIFGKRGYNDFDNTHISLAKVIAAQLAAAVGAHSQLGGGQETGIKTPVDPG